MEGWGWVLARRPYLVGEAMQAVLVAAHHQDLVDPDKPHRLGAQLDAVLGALGVSVEERGSPSPEKPSLSPWLTLLFLSPTDYPGRNLGPQAEDHGILPTCTS